MARSALARLAPAHARAEPGDPRPARPDQGVLAASVAVGSASGPPPGGPDLPQGPGCDVVNARPGGAASSAWPGRGSSPAGRRRRTRVRSAATRSHGPSRSPSRVSGCCGETRPARTRGGRTRARGHILDGSSKGVAGRYRLKSTLGGGREGLIKCWQIVGAVEGGGRGCGWFCGRRRGRRWCRRVCTRTTEVGANHDLNARRRRPAHLPHAAGYSALCRDLVAPRPRSPWRPGRARG